MTDLSRYEEIIIWGASFPPTEMEGDATSHGRAIEKLADLLRKEHSLKKVICIVDSNQMLHGKRRLGIPVMPPTVILEHPDALIIINTVSIKAIQQAMADMEIKNDYRIIPYYFYHGTVNHPYTNEVAQKDTQENEEKIKSLYDLNDAHTKRYMDIILSMRKKGEDDLYSGEDYDGTGESLVYFCDPKLAPRNDVTFIDVGAYQGDSLAPILDYYQDKLKKYIAFEPDEKNCKRLKEYVRKRQFIEQTTIFPYALGTSDGMIRFSSTGPTSQISDDGEIVLEQKAFDHLPGIEIVGDAMVKMDIEGAELDALRGMEHFIRKYQPYLAICLYHKEADLYEIADYIKGLNPGYRLYLRGGWHLECWAVPQKHFE